VVCNIVSERRVGTLAVCEPVGKNALKRLSSQGGKGNVGGRKQEKQYGVTP
jgi:hypothetical protein